jgi:two-component system response regulator FixJ
MSSSLVHLIDDDEDVRRALAFLLGTAGLAVKVYESASDFLDRHDAPVTGCIVTDVRMPEIDGLELLRRLREKHVAVPVIVMTGHADVPMAVDAMKNGAVDFIEKPFADDVLLDAIARAFKLAETPAPGRDAAARERFAALSYRERQVLSGLLAGLPNKTIAYDLGLSPRTVEVHRANVMTKTGVASLSELVRLALQGGIT